jgi:bifunctional DNA primase/polymerase-like protein/uncharacterized protein DUF5906
MASSNTFSMVDEALHLAARGFRVFPVHRNKIPCIEAWQIKATTDPEQIEAWWREWPSANIGILCGDDLVVIDVDGSRGAGTLRKALGAYEWPKTLQVRTGRQEGGLHAYFSVPEGIEVESSAGGGIEVQYTGHYVIAPPSLHKSGKRYEWIKPEQIITPIPAWLVEALNARPRGSRAKRPKASAANVPEHLKGLKLPRLAERATIGMNDVPFEDLMAAAEALPNEGLEWPAYTRFCMAFWRASNGSAEGLEACGFWSKKSPKHEQKEKLADRWAHYHKSPPDSIGFGAIVFAIRETQPDWEPPSRGPKQEEKEQVRQHDAADETELNGHAFPFDDEVDDPKALIVLNDFNKRFAVISDIGGKCLVLSWVPSKAENGVLITSFQTFKSFAERFAHQYVKIRVQKAKEIEYKSVQAGLQWLKWRSRKTYEGIDLVPDIENLPKGYLNMWRGFAVEPRAGSWRLMQRHVIEVLAAGDRASAEYIFRFAAWAVQNPGERAQVALVFKGGKGIGKGTFANAFKRLFGSHGLQINSSKHLVGAFNGHLRNCLLLFSDEAFWAGDKPGESVLKGLLTEPTLVIEQKGIDAVPWKNRLHVIMAANNEWVVPASHDERRYAVFEVSTAHQDDEPYFNALHAEINGSGLSAMLYDLQRVDLGEWHPRRIVKTAALREQKIRSLDYRHEWWEGTLQSGFLPGTPNEKLEVQAAAVYDHIRRESPRLKDVSITALGRFLRSTGAEGLHKAKGNFWRFLPLTEARKMWEAKFGAWEWRNQLVDWNKEIPENHSQPFTPFSDNPLETLANE